MKLLKKHYKLITFVIIVIVIVLLNHRYGWSDYLSSRDNWGSLQAMVRTNFWEALLLYTVLTIVGCVVLALPGVTFAVFAGLLFGPWIGTAACLVATTLGAIAAYLVGKFFLKDSIKPLVMKNNWLRKVLFEDAGRSDLVVLMITRLVPLFPYNLQNFAYGITDISLTHYSLYTLVFMTPGVAMFTIASAGLIDGGKRTTYFIIAAALLALVMFLGWFIRRKFLAKDEAEIAEEEKKEATRE